VRESTTTLVRFAAETLIAFDETPFLSLIAVKMGPSHQGHGEQGENKAKNQRIEAYGNEFASEGQTRCISSMEAAAGSSTFPWRILGRRVEAKSVLE